MTATIKYRKDYQPTNFLISHCNLELEIFADHVIVNSQLSMKANPAYTGQETSCELDGLALELLDLEILESSSPLSYAYDASKLTINDPPPEFTLRSSVKINPYNNTSLEGLYKSGSILCTQNEAEGFRHLSFFIDRPDIMCIFTTRITADREQYPLVLSNGNKIGSELLANGRHAATWEDPIPKPCYLFAVVAGNLDCIEDYFTTMSGRSIKLQIFTDLGKSEYARYALTVLKKSMRWDEENFGREYDLDLYMIVAVDSFNFGAMENKGLNIFNSVLVLADNETATDADFSAINSVISHEYFHNWTGNRITCRDWFQITLKEGLTVYRDQEFSADTENRVLERIGTVQRLRETQFSEDRGPNSHPIRPDSYIEINNFYSPTVYEKGAEVIRMLARYLGRVNFRKGMDLYFMRHDGQAVTCDDFVKSIADATASDLDWLSDWYSQAGTPVLDIAMDYKEGALAIHVHQDNNSAPAAKFLKIPFSYHLYSEAGACILQEDSFLARQDQSFLHENISSKPIPLFMPNFAAPVIVNYPYSEADLLRLITASSDFFSRYDFSQKIYRLHINRFLENPSAPISNKIISVLESIILDRDISYGLKTKLLTVPSIQNIIGEQDEIDCMAIGQAIEKYKRFIYTKLQVLFLENYTNLINSEYTNSQESVEKRSWQNTCLGFLAIEPKNHELVYSHYKQADNMTNKQVALKLLKTYPGVHTEAVFADFFAEWKDNFLVICRWFALQLQAPRLEVLDTLSNLQSNPYYQKNNPNMIRAVFGSILQNLAVLHSTDGRAYKLLTDEIIRLDSINTHMSCSLLTKTFILYEYVRADLKELMRRELLRIRAVETLSPGATELSMKILK